MGSVKAGMKILICNVPLRGEKLKTVYPPLGVLAVMQSLISEGYDPVFYDINLYRPDDEHLGRYFAEQRFDVIGISATVSTSYAYVKKLAALIRAASPDSVIIVGGALTASADIVLRYAGADVCVIGEGERVIVNLAKHLAACGPKDRRKGLENIKGICFLGTDRKSVFTGYEDQLPVDRIADPDYGLIEKFSNPEQYIVDPLFYEQFKHDKRFYDDRRKGKRLATVVSSRGCVNRCSFCYRWQRGIRVYPVDRVIAHVKHLMDRYNVGFISFGDEDFGASRGWTEELVKKIAPLDILYRVSGICCDNVDLDLLKRLRESGCVAVHYGFESGSNDMLKVIEKRADVELNTRVASETREAGLQTVPALVVGMPGESFRTIAETTEFMKKITEKLPRPPIISINALVALPGTPVYEYARHRGFLGTTSEDEERYLLRISDRGGSSMKQLNLTDYPYFIVQSWIRCVAIAVRYNYYRKNGLSSLSMAGLARAVADMVLRRPEKRRPLQAELYSNAFIYHSRYLVSVLLVMAKNLKEDRALFMQRCRELAMWPFRKRFYTRYVSLRSFLKEYAGDSNSMPMMRMGM